MDANTLKVLIGAVGGLLAAILVDLDAWKADGGSFNIYKALPRWVYGAFAGGLAGAGISLKG